MSDLEHTAIERLKAASEMSLQYYKQPLVICMGKHPIGGMRSMMVPNRKADMRFRKKSYLRNKNTAERSNRNDQRRSNHCTRK